MVYEGQKSESYSETFGTFYRKIIGSIEETNFPLVYANFPDNQSKLQLDFFRISPNVFPNVSGEAITSNPVEEYIFYWAKTIVTPHGSIFQQAKSCATHATHALYINTILQLKKSHVVFEEKCAFSNEKKTVRLGFCYR